MSLIALNQIYKRMIMQLLISLNRAGLLVQSPVALTKPASMGYLYRVLLLWQSLQVQVTCTESCCSDKACKYKLLVQSCCSDKACMYGLLVQSCCSDKACKYGLLVQSHVALTKPANMGYLYRVLLLWQSLHVQVCVLCRCDYEQSLRWRVHVISDLFAQSLHVCIRYISLMSFWWLWCNMGMVSLLVFVGCHGTASVWLQWT